MKEKIVDQSEPQRLGCSLHGGVARAELGGGTGWIDCAPEVCGHEPAADRCSGDVHVMPHRGCILR